MNDGLIIGIAIALLGCIIMLLWMRSIFVRCDRFFASKQYNTAKIFRNIDKERRQLYKFFARKPRSLQLRGSSPRPQRGISSALNTGARYWSREEFDVWSRGDGKLSDAEALAIYHSYD